MRASFRIPAASSAALFAVPAPVSAAETPMSYLRAFGAQAAEILPLTWWLTGVSVFVVFVIAALVLIGALRRRQPGAGFGKAPLAIERSGSGLSWISIGVGLSMIPLLVSMGWAVVTLAAIDRPEQEPKLTIDVVGHQWWWEVHYQGETPSRRLTTANEIHIPVGEPVRFRLSTSDVIHSFWVPALGGKTDLIPGQTNVTWLQADEAGIYRGQCGEYCGEQHAHMVFQLVAEPPAAFAEWWDEQLEPAEPPSTAEQRQAQAHFVARCGACHSVRGTAAGGGVGPDLTHLMSRDTIAAGMLLNTTAHLTGWIANPQGIKPGSRMPNLELSGPELTMIRSYLETLD